MITINSHHTQMKRQVIIFILFNIKDDKIKYGNTTLLSSLQTGWSQFGRWARLPGLSYDR